MALLGLLPENYNKTHPNPEGPVILPKGTNVNGKGKYNSYLVGASYYGGPSDPGTPGHTGSNGTDLTTNNGDWFAELGMGTLLGDLPYGFELEVTDSNTGKSVFVKKGDIGLGGTPVQGHARRIDLWYTAAAAIGFTGTGLVYLTAVSNNGTFPKKTATVLATSLATQGSVPNTLQQAEAAGGQTVSVLGDVGNLFSNWKLVLLGLAGAVIGVVAIVEIASSTKAGQSAGKVAAAAA
jgi:hypothetical protein